MSSEIPNLWPEEYNVNVQSPLSILKVQASFLGKSTRGILEGVVESEESKELVQHRLIVVAPACDGYRHTLIVVRHTPTMLYPTEVRAAGLGTVTITGNTIYPKASSENELLELLSKAIVADEAKSVILSLIAKSNEVQNQKR